jgi:hypothetical protein
MEEHGAAIVLVDDSIGTGGYREIHARLADRFGAMGFFLFAITEGKRDDFTQFAAAARIDGVIFRPYEKGEFLRRFAEVFSVKWPNRYVESPASGGADLYLVRGKTDAEIVEKALEKERRLGYRDPLTPDPKFVSIFGMKRTEHPAIRGSKVAFEKVRLSFKAVARNGEGLEKALPIHAMEIDGFNATFECAASGSWEKGDHVTIEAEIVHGGECYALRIEAKVSGEAGVGLIAVEFDEGNRTRFEAAMRMVAKRFKELKDFFKYAKGA